jgi:protein-S-isoprenylcysteine O-methyltransferase Ste14
MSTQEKVITPRVVLQMLFFLVIWPLIPLLVSRQWDWWEAWVYFIVSLLGFVISRILANRRNPDLIAERAHSMEKENAQPWDKKLYVTMAVFSIVALVVVGLDKLYGWAPDFSLAVELVALFFVVAGYALGAYALIENRYFSGVVRLQTERGHQVVSSGPYRWVRHPGYAGAIITYLATPFFLDSAWALLPTLVVLGALVVRTSKEDQFLQAELDGYREYAGRVRYRLLPWGW